MIDFSKLKLNYNNIHFENRKLSEISSRSDISVAVELNDWLYDIPVVFANMKSIQSDELLKFIDSSNVMYSRHRIDGAEDVYKFCLYARENSFSRLSISIGVKQEWISLLHRLKHENIYPDYICLDIANSFNLNIIEVSRTVNQLFPNSFYIVGNGMSREWIQWLENIKGTRVDAAKVSVGVSAACRTANETGFKSSTIGHLDECASAAKRVKIIADGGLTIVDDQINLGDIAKAIRFGADMIWSGSIWARCTDNPAYVHGYSGNSTAEMKGYSDNIEGCTVKINKASRNTEETIKHIKESLQSSVSYCGGKSLRDLRQADYWIKL